MGFAIVLVGLAGACGEIAQQPDIVYLKDTTGSGKANVRVRVLSGLDSADTHHAANSFQVDPGGASGCRRRAAPRP